MLVDPLAALLRPELDGQSALVFDETEVVVALPAPLAIITIARRFTNSSERLVEAVLTLPPLAADEVCYRLIVRVGGVEYEAAPRPTRRARTEHETALSQGRRAILFELLNDRIPLLSIAGIEPGARVEVIIWTIKPLARRHAEQATLLIALSAATDAATPFGLADADAYVTARARHAASLQVSAGALQVSISGQPYPDQRLEPNEAIGVECSTPIFLMIVPLDGGSLDHSEWQVAQPGGWEVTSERGQESFRHSRNPTGEVSSARDDWIFGARRTAAGEIRVTAPLSDDVVAPAASGSPRIHPIAPNARGMRAFAAAGFIEAAAPRDAAAVRIAANVLSGRTSLAFIGPEGELPDELPTLRKLALAEMASLAFPNEPQPPIAEPPPREEDPAPPGPALPIKLGPQNTPGGAAPGQRQRAWVAVAMVVALVVVGVVAWSRR